MTADVAVDTERQVEEGVPAARSRSQPGKRPVQGRRFRRETVRSFARDFDDPIHDQLCRQRGKHLRTCGLDLDEAEAGQFLHRQVDLRRRHITLTAQRGGVGDAAKHQCHERFSFVEHQSNVFESLGVGQVHSRIIYYRE